MRTALPVHLIVSIVRIALASDAEVASAAAVPATCPAPSMPLTLWDVGFSIRDSWAALREQDLARDPPPEECPVPPDITEEAAAPADDAPPPASPTESEATGIVGFEEWKKLQETVSSSSEPSPTFTPPDSDPTEHPYSSSTSIEPLKTPTPSHSSHRYNYASPDCGARVQASSKLSQHASSILHKSRDRYMLTPCKADEHWVMLELCDEIRVESIEIAVWEFFSGVVREVKVSALDEGDGEAVHVATFTGKNVRGVQTFQLPNPTSFYRFLRLDFPSFYGSEYYCPVSQVKVFGMNQLEAFKWEQKRLDAEMVEPDKVIAPETTPSATPDPQAQARKEAEAKAERELGELEKLVQAQARRLGVPPITALPSPPLELHEELHTINATASSNATSINVTSTNATASSKPGRKADSESIYAFIIRRLNDLEGNSSLVARYIDEQARAIRSALNRTEQDIQEWRQRLELEDSYRWERERMRHEDRLGRIISQLEQQRLVLEVDRRSIEAQLRLLADELGYERRRGIASLFILIIVIALGVASRGTAIDALLKPLLAEARRRRVHGPLTGLKIDMGVGRPPVVIGQPRPPPSPTPTAKTTSKALGRSDSGSRRSATPTMSRKRQSLFLPNVRLTSDYLPLTSPRMRASLPPKVHSHVPQRRLAKSAHLHSIDTHTYAYTRRADDHVDWASASEVDEEDARGAQQEILDDIAFNP